MKRPFILYPLLSLHLFLGLSALVGGGLLMIDPDGALLGMKPGWLDHSPFSTYFLPGFILLLFNGLLPLLTFIGLLFKPDWNKVNVLNIYIKRHWAWAYSLYSGIILITWITVQITMTHYFWLQPVMIFTGLLIIIFTLFPTVMDYVEKG